MTISAVKWKPLPYMKTAVKFLIEHGAAGLFLDPGLGKTSISLAAFKILKDEKLVKRMLVVTPLRPAYLVWPLEVQKWIQFDDLRVVVLHGKTKAENLLKHGVADVYVINPEGLPWLMQQHGVISKNFFDVLCVDECFPRGTMVTTTCGERPIESLRVGDFVVTSSGSQRILRVGARKVDVLVELELSNGVKLRCTPEHPVFTSRGWIPADRTQGEIIYGEVDLSDLQEGVHGAIRNDAPAWEEKMLLAILRSEADVVEVHAVSIEDSEVEYVCKQLRPPGLEQRSRVADRSQEKDVEDIQGLRTYVQSAWWKWTWTVILRKIIGDRTAQKIYLELRNKIGAEASRLSYELQSRLRRSDNKVSDRGRWCEPPQRGQTVEGQKENGQAERIRVERVTRLKLRREEDVFNLVVEKCPHFFANGILVHNSSKFKNTRTERFKLIKVVLGCFKRRWILTGSPAANGLLDLFGQIYILDLGRALGAYITHYRLTYFAPTGYGGYQWVPQKGSEQRIYKALAPLVLRMSERDYLNLPPMTVTNTVVDLPNKAYKIYKEMEVLLFTALDSGEARAVNQAVALMKCRQIANGGIYIDEDGDSDDRSSAYRKSGRPWSKVHDEKTDAVVELVDELEGQPCLVAYEFDHDLKRLAAALPSNESRRVEIAANANTKEKLLELQRAWNNGQIQVMLVQPQSIAHGLNLQAGGRAVIIHSLNYNYEDYDQLIRRVYRQGQTKRVFIHRIVARRTVDEAIISALNAKKKGQKALFDALTAYRMRQKRV